jgi:hypothetical protein
VALPKLKIYCIGKIDKNDWRHKLFPGLRGACFPDADDQFVAKGRFEYCGPFFIACNHGCFHGESTHGRAAPVKACWDGFQHGETRRQVKDKCLKWLKKADIVFAWIDEATAYGSLTEIGWAHVLKKPIYLAFPHDARFVADMWFACEQAAQVTRARNAEEAWKFFEKWVKEAQPGDKLQAFQALGL